LRFDATTDMVVKVADVRGIGVFVVWKISEAIIWGQMSGEGDCSGFPLKCCFTTT